MKCYNGFADGSRKSDVEGGEAVTSEIDSGAITIEEYEDVETISQGKLLEFGDRIFNPPKPSIEEPPELELKPLLKHLKYVYQGDNCTLPVIISTKLTE